MKDEFNKHKNSSSVHYTKLNLYKKDNDISKKISSSSDYSNVIQIEKKFTELDISTVFKNLNPEDNFNDEKIKLLETLNTKLKDEINLNVSC
jgi:hypothetical protein